MLEHISGMHRQAIASGHRPCSSTNGAQESYFTYGQDEESPVDHDIHFRPGVGSDGSETYTPRTVIYDLKGAFGTLRRDNALYQLQSQDEAGQEGQWYVIPSSA